MKNKKSITDSNNNNNNNQTNNTMKNNNQVPTEVVEYLCAYFEQYGALPTPVIECNETGTAYTAFGTNLKNKIEKAGGLKELLTSFIGRGAKMKAKKTLDEKIQEVRQEVQTAKKRVRPSRSKAAIAERAAVKAAAVEAATA